MSNRKEHLERAELEARQHEDALREHRARILGALKTFGELKREEADDEARRLLREGQRDQAMKRYRELTGVGLREAQDAIDAAEIWIYASSLPDENVPPPVRRRPWGWFVVVALVCAGLALFLW